MEKIIFLSRRLLTIMMGICIPVSAFLLMMHGKWWAIGYGLCAIAAPFILQRLFMPAAMLRRPALYFLDRRQPTRAALMLVAGGLYECMVINIWFCGIFYLFMQYSDADNFWVIVAFAYGISLAPWLFISERLRLQETAGDAQRFFIASAHIAYLLIAAALIYGSSSALQLMEIFAAVTALGSLIGSALAWLKLKRSL